MLCGPKTFDLPLAACSLHSVPLAGCVLRIDGGICPFARDRLRRSEASEASDLVESSQPSRSLQLKL